MKEKSIGNILLKARQKAKISQDLLAQQLHISRQSISNWENGNGLPDLDMLKTLCDKLDLNYKKILKKYPSHSVNNKKLKRKNIYLLVLIIILIFVMSLLIILRTKVIFYNLSIDDNNYFLLKDSYLIKSNNYVYFNLGEIFSKNTLEDMNDYEVRIYLKNKDEIRLLFDSNYTDNIVLEESFGYGEYFNNNFNINLLYLDLISLKDSMKTYSFKLIPQIKFKNENIINISKKKISNSSDKNMNSSFIGDVELNKNNYVFNDGYYIKEVDNGTYQYDKKFNILTFLNDYVHLQYIISNETILGNEYNYKTKEIIINFVYNINNKQLTCYSDSCKDYEKYLNILFDEYKKLIN